MQARNILRPAQRTRGFTLAELLIVFMIIAILAGMALSALSGAQEMARASRTRAIITKLDQLIMEKWEGYQTRAVPVKNTTNLNPRSFAGNRLNALRELMRMELPDRTTDVKKGVQTLSTAPSLWRGHNRRAGTNWSVAFDGAECLYLIIGSMKDGDQSALEFFTSDEIGDFDNDGMKEILDGWGQPIEFLRWAPGYTIENGALTSQTTDSNESPDPFDPLKVDSRWSNTDVNLRPYALRPLIYSAGPDKEYAISVGSDSSNVTTDYTLTTPKNDPYVNLSSGEPAGFPATGHEDNITNHYEAP